MLEHGLHTRIPHIAPPQSCLGVGRGCVAVMAQAAEQLVALELFVPLQSASRRQQEKQEGVVALLGLLLKTHSGSLAPAPVTLAPRPPHTHSPLLSPPHDTVPKPTRRATPQSLKSQSRAAAAGPAHAQTHHIPPSFAQFRGPSPRRPWPTQCHQGTPTCLWACIQATRLCPRPRPLPLVTTITCRLCRAKTRRAFRAWATCPLPVGGSP